MGVSRPRRLARRRSPSPLILATCSRTWPTNLWTRPTDTHNAPPQAPTPLPPQQQQAIVNFEMSLATAQAIDNKAGALNADGATGGPITLGNQTLPAFFVGINDPLGGNPHGIPFTPVIFNLFNAWANGDDRDSRRARIAR